MIGDHVDVVYGDGVVQSYVVSNIIRYQAMQPYSPNSTFVNLDTNEQLSANNLFYQVYSGSHHLTLQTCIQEGVVDSWGRLFIIAEPVDAGQLASLPNS
jgi:hypothetical protein